MKCRWWAGARPSKLLMFLLNIGADNANREMVSLIPRLSSLAVSGTPVKTHVADLIKVLTYGIPVAGQKHIAEPFTASYALTS